MKTLMFLLLSLLYISCNNGLPQEELSKYRSGIIYDKIDVPHHLLYVIKYKNKIITVKCYEIDFKYNIGDTIK